MTVYHLLLSRWYQTALLTWIHAWTQFCTHFFPTISDEASRRCCAVGMDISPSSSTNVQTSKWKELRRQQCLSHPPITVPVLTLTLPVPESHPLRSRRIIKMTRTAKTLSIIALKLKSSFYNVFCLGTRHTLLRWIDLRNNVRTHCKPTTSKTVHWVMKLLFNVLLCGVDLK